MSRMLDVVHNTADLRSIERLEESVLEPQPPQSSKAGRALQTQRKPMRGAEDNPAARLGAVLAELAQQGGDKLTLVADPPLESFGDWLEQLIAESTGKEGHGILPVVGEQIGLNSETRLWLQKHHD